MVTVPAPEIAPVTFVVLLFAKSSALELMIGPLSVCAAVFA